MMRIPLLLTATVNPNGMKGAAFSVEERAMQYVEAVAFYLKTLPAADTIVFAENSHSIPLVAAHFAGETRVEWLDVSDLDAPYAYDQTKGKGYNEWLLMRQAMTLSHSIAESGCFFKVTGRLKIHNIGALLNEVKSSGVNKFLADCKDHKVYDWLKMPINGHAGECRYFFSSRDFFLDEVFPEYALMNDYSNPPYLAEDLMLKVCRKARRTKGAKDRFKTQARISGRGGHVLGQGMAFFYSTDNDSLTLRFKCAIRQLLRWVLPWWRC